MTQVEVHLVRAFSMDEHGGNLAGIVLEADSLTDQQKQKVALEVGVSETAFVSSSQTADFQVSFFTPTDEVDFCGHATLGVFWLLQHLQSISVGTFSQETKAGVLLVDVKVNGNVIMDQQLPKWKGEFSAEDVAPLLGLDAELIAQVHLPISLVSTGLADVLIPVPYGVLDILEVDHDAISLFCQKNQCVGLHVFEINPPEALYTVSCRNFAPLFGIPEESATGSSSGALSCYLNKYLGYKEALLEQGRIMGMSSRIETKIINSDGVISRVQVGGAGCFEKTITIQLS